MTKIKKIVRVHEHSTIKKYSWKLFFTLKMKRMMILIKITIDKLKREDDETLYINHHKILKIKHTTKQTILVLENDEVLNVIETPEEIIKKIKEYETSSQK